MQIDYFGQKKVKISNQTLWAKRKIGSLKTFHFPHLKYQFPKGGEQNHPSVKKGPKKKVLRRVVEGLFLSNTGPKRGY